MKWLNNLMSVKRRNAKYDRFAEVFVIRTGLNIYLFLVGLLMKGWKTLSPCGLYWIFPCFFFPQTCWSVICSAALGPFAVGWHRLPPPLSAAWKRDTAVTSGSGRGAAGSVTWCKKDLPLSQRPVFLNLLLFFSLILLSPALGAQASPSLVAIKPTSFSAEQLWLVHMDPTSLVDHLCRSREAVTNRERSELN